MIINGLQKLTLLDYPGHTACTVFTAGCNMRCPFCHNAILVLDAKNQSEISEEDFFAFLSKRKGLLDGVAVTGGEPALRPGLCEFLEKVKALGFDTKLDTNGCYPEVLKSIVENSLVDYVAMDIKSSPEGYPSATGIDGFDISGVMESVEFLKKRMVDFEFRTTVVNEIHTADDFRKIGEWIKGSPRYFLQVFKDNGGTLKEGLTAPGKEKMLEYLAIVSPYVENAAIRGMDF